MNLKRWIILFTIILFILPACFTKQNIALKPTGSISISILHTNDEHGWLLPTKKSNSIYMGGALCMMNLWTKQEGYNNDSFVVLSGGDMWTGPSISTWFKGESTLEVMNSMGYRAAVLGNHDFDFGRDILKKRSIDAKFPFLAANITTKDGKMIDFAAPYTIIDISGIKIGLIGLVTQDTIDKTKYSLISDIKFCDYADTLRRYVPDVKNKGASIVIVLTHICIKDLSVLADQVKDLKIPLMFGGHCHESENHKVGYTWIVESGYFMNAYSRVDMQVDLMDKTVNNIKVKIVKNESDKSSAISDVTDSNFNVILDKWRNKTDSELHKVIGYTKKGIQRPWPLYNMVMDAWLWSYPQADIAISNVGGFRQDINTGVIKLADIVGVLPFENVIYEIKITGAQVLDNLKCCGDAAVSGIKFMNGKFILTKTSRPIELGSTYRILINDFMYLGGNKFLFRHQDPLGYNTGINWRQPVIDWLIMQKSSASAPIDAKIDSEARYR